MVRALVVFCVAASVFTDESEAFLVRVLVVVTESALSEVSAEVLTLVPEIDTTSVLIDESEAVRGYLVVLVAASVLRLVSDVERALVEV